MSSKRNVFRRKISHTRKKLFVISTEGSNTEKQYFKIIQSNIHSHGKVQIHILKYKGSAPSQVLKTMELYLRDHNLQESDEAWLVIDKDNWLDKQIKELYKWCVESKERNLALSNPMFEFWLLLHFEDGYGIQSAKDCLQYLEKYIPNFKKNLPESIHKTLYQNVHKAIDRAKKITPSRIHWPRKTGTTVYRLLEKLNNYESDA